MRRSCDVPRLVISSYKGKAGKTVATLELYDRLTKAGYKVSLFKVGPDFIDPSYHEALSGKPSRNLDHILMGEKVVERFCVHSRGSDVALVEGVHGLYDSPDGISEEGSTAQVAKLLKAPVLLVINGERVNRTAAAMTLGLRAFDPEVRFAGAFLTEVAEGKAEKMKASLAAVGVRVLGVLYKSESIAETMRYRHLGLVHMHERDTQVLGAIASASSDVDAPEVLTMAAEGSEPLKYSVDEGQPDPRGPRPRIGMAYGRTFSFNYPETVEEASKLGRLVLFDPEKDQTVDADVIIMGGGFPEVYAEGLEKNKPMKAFIRSFVEKGRPLYAECGGLMYLARSIEYRGSEHEMAGVFDARGTVHDRPVGHGYAWGRLERDTVIGHEGLELKGHEFHYTELRTTQETTFRYARGRGIDGRDGLTYRNVYAHFMHIHPVTYNFVRRIVAASESV